MGQRQRGDDMQQRVTGMTQTQHFNRIFCGHNYENKTKILKKSSFNHRIWPSQDFCTGTLKSIIYVVDLFTLRLNTHSPRHPLLSNHQSLSASLLTPWRSKVTSCWKHRLDVCLHVRREDSQQTGKSTVTSFSSPFSPSPLEWVNAETMCRQEEGEQNNRRQTHIRFWKTNEEIFIVKLKNRERTDI